MSETEKPERLQIILTRDELAALDDWRFANRMPTRAAAIRELMRRGMTLQADGSRGLGIQRSRDVRFLQNRPAAGNGHNRSDGGNGARYDSN